MSDNKKPPIEKRSVVARLERARDEQLSVRVRRWIPHADHLDGFVVGLGAKWVALARLDDGVRLDGWYIVRTKDIQSVGIDPDPGCFEVRVLKARGQWPPTSPSVDLDDVTGLITSAAAAAPLLSVFVEFDRPDICWIGSVTSVQAKKLRLLEVDTQAEWKRKPRSIDPADITRIDISGTTRRPWHSSLDRHPLIDHFVASGNDKAPGGFAGLRRYAVDPGALCRW